MRPGGERLGLLRGCGLVSAFLRLPRNEIKRRSMRRRRAGGGRRFGQPGPAYVRFVVRLLRIRRLKLSPRGVVTVGHCKFLLQLSDDANVGRSQYQPSRTRTRLAWAYLRVVHFCEAANTPGGAKRATNKCDLDVLPLPDGVDVLGQLVALVEHARPYRFVRQGYCR
jgi:hypothetical protein